MLQIRHVIAIVLALSSCCAAATTAEIEKSLAAGRDWLYKQQQNGNWEYAGVPEGGNPQTRGSQYTGFTALSVLALLNSGEKPQDPRIKSAIEFLLKNRTEGVYALGVRCQIWLMLPPTQATREAMSNDARILLSSVKKQGNARGMYDYAPGPNEYGMVRNVYSHSRSQYAVLGMWAAAQSGFEVPDSYWKLVEEAWIRNQDKSGGWLYTNRVDMPESYPVTAGMTNAGVASLLITQEYLRAQDGVLCKGNQISEPVERGLKWLADYTRQNAADAGFIHDRPYASLYSYERVGAASGLRYLGGVDWFVAGADWAIKRQKPDGSWNYDGSVLGNFSDTCFAMLFLAKGRAPIVISKLQYANEAGKEGQWNQRGRDVANLVRWMGRTLERDLGFAVVDLKAPLEDLLESPILYIAGKDAVNLSDVDKTKLKAYIEGGGIVLANADCGSAAFSTSIKKLGKDLFPDAEFGELPADDLIYTGYYPRSKWRTKPSVLCLKNGVRPLMLLIPQADLAKAWQLQDAHSRLESFELPTDLLLYAVDRTNLRYRGVRYYVPDDPAAKVGKTINVARLKYAGAWDPEPGGWRRLNNVMKQRQSTAVGTTVAELGKNQIGAAKIAHLTGAAPYKFSDAEKDELKRFIAGGGTLVIDVAGGNGGFAGSIETALSEMYPTDKLQPLPADHPLYGGEPHDEIAYRSFAIHNGVGRTNAPRLQGITLNGRLAVIYSREDLSEGLVGQSIDGILGYSPATATNLMARILNCVVKPAAAKQ
jgi:hypothetical protein